MPGGTNVVLGQLAEQDAAALRALLKLPGKHWRSKAIRFALHFTAANYRPAEPAPEQPATVAPGQPFEGGAASTRG